MTTEKETTNEQMKNPREFIYPQGKKVEIEGYVLTDLIMIFEQLLKDEVKVESKFKYNYVNEKGRIVKNAKPEELETGKVQKVLDFKRTIVDPNMEYSITEKGIAYAELKNFLESLHFENIEKGVAVNYKELSEKPMVEPIQE